MRIGGPKSKDKTKVHVQTQDAGTKHPAKQPARQDDRERPVQVDDLYHGDAPHAGLHGAALSGGLSEPSETQAPQSPSAPPSPTPLQDLDLLTAGAGGDQDRAGAAQRLQHTMGNRKIGKIPPPASGKAGKE